MRTDAAGALAARWLLRILVTTAGVVVGLALAATTSYADTKPAPLGASVAKVAQKSVGSSAAPKAKAKVVTRSPVAKVKIRIKAKAAPVRKVARKVAPVRSYRATKVVRTAPKRIAPARTYRAPKVSRTVAKRTARPVTVRPRISTVQRKATASEARLAKRMKAAPTKINNAPSKIIKSSVRKAAPVKSSPSAELAKAAQTRPIDASVELTLPAVGTAEAKVSVLPVETSVSPVEVAIPLLNLPTVTLPPGTPTVSLPPTDPLTGTPPGSRPAVTAPRPQADERAASVHWIAAARAQDETARTPQGALAGVGTTLVTALTASTPSMQVRSMLSLGPPVVAIINELGQQFRNVKVPDSFGPTATALVLAAAIGAAATGTAGSASAGASGLAVLSTALRLPALGGSRRLRGRLRESAFGRPRLPGFAPD